MRLQTHDAVLGFIPLRAETAEAAINELKAGETVQRAWLAAGAPDEWCTQIFDVYDADTGEEIAVSIDMECWDVLEDDVIRARNAYEAGAFTGRV